MLNRLVSAAFFLTLLSAGQALAQESGKEDRTASLCFGRCSGGLSLIAGLEAGTDFPQPVLPDAPDLRLPDPPYGSRAWSPWIVCLSLGISPGGTLVCRQWSDGERSPLIRSPYWRIPTQSGGPIRSGSDFVLGNPRPSPFMIIDGPHPENCGLPFFGCLGIRGHITLY